jgi:hypothetical protein
VRFRCYYNVFDVDGMEGLLVDKKVVLDSLRNIIYLIVIFNVVALPSFGLLFFTIFSYDCVHVCCAFADVC